MAQTDLQKRAPTDPVPGSLFETFSRGRAGFREQLIAARSPEDCARLIRLELDRVENLTLGSLTPHQIGPTRTLIHILRETAIYLASRESAPATTAAPPPPPGSQHRFFNVELMARLTQACLLAAIVFVAVPASFIPGAAAVVLLVSGIVLAEAGRALHRRDVAALSGRPSAISRVYRPDEVGIVRLLEEALDTIDHFNETLALPVDANSGADPRKSNAEVLEFLQRMSGYLALDQSRRIVQLAELAPEILHRLGVTPVQFEPDNEDIAPEWFLFEPHTDPDARGYVTIRPALVREGEVIVKGRVIEPVPAPAAAS